MIYSGDPEEVFSPYSTDLWIRGCIGLEKVVENIC